MGWLDGKRTLVAGAGSGTAGSAGNGCAFDTTPALATGAHTAPAAHATTTP